MFCDRLRNGTPKKRNIKAKSSRNEGRRAIRVEHLCVPGLRRGGDHGRAGAVDLRGDHPADGGDAGRGAAGDPASRGWAALDGSGRDFDRYGFAAGGDSVRNGWRVEGTGVRGRIPENRTPKPKTYNLKPRT